MKANWKLFFSERKNIQLFWISVCSLAIVLFLFLHFLTYNEGRAGFRFQDPILQLLQPRDISVLIFILTYGVALTGLIIAANDPRLFLSLILAYALLTVLRMICLYLLPLEPPEGIIPLQDVLLRSSFYSGRNNLRDLFFSGHTATLFLFAFAFGSAKRKILFGAAAVLTGCLLLMQHVHYSIDVIAAPLMAWLALRIASGWTKRNRNYLEAAE